ncbi:MAG: hypothetical protein H6656_17855 [Ardenticatenaceae bacterium]|nr:hypothetical protein [Ardenticatenaceae bacterium]
MNQLILYGEKKSRCCKAPTILVKSREGGFVTQNCAKCEKPYAIPLRELPILYCGACRGQLTAFTDHNYFYRCDNCNFRWELSLLVPYWSEIFDKWIGYGLPSDPNFLAPPTHYRSVDHN